MRRRLAILLALAALAAATLPAPAVAGVAAPDSTARRPRIGLVLSGGGARGAAHVGVLKVLEELRVPVDVVVGTSMGSIIGGLYASGLSPRRMTEVVQETDWLAMFDDAPPRQDVPYRRKEDQYDPLFGFELGFRGGRFQLPSGLIAGQKLDFALRALTLHASGIDDFDRLPLPYRAVAVDLADGSPVVFARGDLARVMRASMAIPGAFTPVELDGRLLVDGGVAMNLPVEVALQMGVDIVIAVDVSTPVKKLEGPQTLFSVASRTLDLLSGRNVLEQRALLTEEDLLLVPDLDKITTASFGSLPEAIARGEAVARANAEALRRFSVGEAEYKDYLLRQRWGRPVAPVVDRIEITDCGRVPAEMIRRRIHTRVGEPLDIGTLRTDLEAVNSINEFSGIKFRLEDRAGETVLVISAEEKPWGPGYLRLGMFLQSNLDGEGDFVILANYRYAFVNRLGAEWRTSLRLGSLMGAATDFYQPLAMSGRWFVNPRLEWYRVQRMIFTAPGQRLPVEERRSTAHGEAGISLGRFGELRGGIYRGEVRGRELLTVGADLQTYQRGGWRTLLTLDSFDDSFFPRAGGMLTAEALFSRRDIGARHAYERLQVQAAKALTRGEDTLVLRQKLTWDLDGAIPFYDQGQLGGFLHLSGLEPGEVQGDNLLFGALTYYRRLGGLSPMVGKGIFLGASLETGGAWEGMGDARLADLRLGGTLFLGMETLFGPITLAGGWADQGRQSAYFLLGQPF